MYRMCMHTPNTQYVGLPSTEFLRIPVTFLLMFTRVVVHCNKVVWLLVTLTALLQVQHTTEPNSIVIQIIRNYIIILMTLWHFYMCCATSHSQSSPFHLLKAILIAVANNLIQSSLQAVQSACIMTTIHTLSGVCHICYFCTAVCLGLGSCVKCMHYIIGSKLQFV